MKRPSDFVIFVPYSPHIHYSKINNLLPNHHDILYRQKMMSSQPPMLILGGVRSGKTDYASTLALAEAEQKPHYLAVAEPLDNEMKSRIERHRQARADMFHTIEEPLDLATAITPLPDHSVILIDSLGMWLNNLMMAKMDWPEPLEALTSQIAEGKHRAIFISDEVGLGIIPNNAASRGFGDELGLINQRVASIAETVVFIVAGIPMIIKGQL